MDGCIDLDNEGSVDANDDGFNDSEMEDFIYGGSNGSMMEDVVYGSVNGNADGTNGSTMEGIAMVGCWEHYLAVTSLEQKASSMDAYWECH